MVRNKTMPSFTMKNENGVGPPETCAETFINELEKEVNSAVAKFTNDTKWHLSNPKLTTHFQTHFSGHQL